MANSNRDLGGSESKKVKYNGFRLGSALGINGFEKSDKVVVPAVKRNSSAGGTPQDAYNGYASVDVKNERAKKPEKKADKKVDKKVQPKAKANPKQDKTDNKRQTTTKAEKAVKQSKQNKQKATGKRVESREGTVTKSLISDTLPVATGSNELTPQEYQQYKSRFATSGFNPNGLVNLISNDVGEKANQTREFVNAQALYNPNIGKAGLTGKVFIQPLNTVGAVVNGTATAVTPLTKSWSSTETAVPIGWGESKPTNTVSNTLNNTNGRKVVYPEGQKPNFDFRDKMYANVYGVGAKPYETSPVWIGTPQRVDFTPSEKLRMRVGDMVDKYVVNPLNSVSGILAKGGNIAKAAWNGLTAREKVATVGGIIQGGWGMYNDYKNAKMLQQQINHNIAMDNKNYEMQVRDYNRQLENQINYKNAFYQQNKGSLNGFEPPKSVSEMLQTYGA